MSRFRLFLKSEGAKLREMNAQEKRWYIWEYYKFQILAVLIVLFLLGNLVDAWFFNKPKTAYLHVAWMGSYISPEEQSALAHILTDALVDDKTREEVVITSFVLTGADPTFDQAIQQRFIAMLAAGELHVFIVEREDYVEELADIGFIRAVDRVMDYMGELDVAVYERLIPRLLPVTYGHHQTGEPVIGNYAVSLRGSAVLTGLGIPAEDLYFCKVVMDSHDFPAAQALFVLHD
jgi:hypothetical protein